jgi:hypothetical protein
MLLRSLAATTSSLTRLELQSRVALTPSTAGLQLEAMGWLSSLRCPRLKFESCGSSVEDDDDEQQQQQQQQEQHILSALQQLSQLRQLRLSWPYNAVPWQLTALSSLTRLHVAGERAFQGQDELPCSLLEVDCEACSSIAPVLALTNLTQLTLEVNNLPAGLSSLHQLQQLNLRIHATGLAVQASLLSGMQQLTQLTQLSLDVDSALCSLELPGHLVELLTALPLRSLSLEVQQDPMWLLHVSKLT